MILRILLVGALLVWIVIPILERVSIYYPNIPTREIEMTPRQVGLDFEEVAFQAADGVRLTGWWIPADPARGTVIFFHGNAGNISHRLFQAEFFHKLGLQLLLFDYRGYGGSDGSPTERGLYQDALGAWAYVVARKQVDKDRLIYYGESLGVAVAVEQALRDPPQLLVLESGFTSVPAMARRIYPWLPIGGFLRSRYDNLSKIGKVTCPTLFIHSREDEIIPFAHGEQLFSRSGARLKRLLPLKSGHNELFVNHHDQIAKELTRFLEEAGG